MASIEVPVWAMGVVALTAATWAVARTRRANKERRRTQGRAAALAASLQRMEDIADGSSGAILLTDLAGVVVYASSRVRQLLEVLPETLVLGHITELAPSGDHEHLIAAAERAAKAGPDTSFGVEYDVDQTNGSTRTLEALVSRIRDGASVSGLVWTIRDVSDRRARDALRGGALHDRLTGLANRQLFIENLDTALERVRRTDAKVALVVLDIDDFRHASDVLWHRVTDEIVLTVATRIGAALRPGDQVARTEVDEFMLLLDGFDDLDEIVERTQLVLSQIAIPMDVGGSTIEISATGAIAVSRGEDAGTAALAHELMQEAAIALAVAKQSDRGGARIFDTSMRSQSRAPVDIAADLRTALIADDQIRVVYQPLVHLESLALEGFEALVRWEHPERGSISATNLIRIAEETGSILELGRLVLRKACQQTADWCRDNPTRLIRISVNVSPDQLAADAFVDEVREALDSSGLPASQLVLEITESALLNDVASVRDRLQQLRVLGVRVAMDDFGTGYSSLAHLRRLPLDILKIDKSFLDDEADAGTHLLSAVIDLGTSLGLDTVAEGIEMPMQLETARNAACTFGQGYLIARPLDADAATIFIQEHRTLAQVGGHAVSRDGVLPLT
jgi:diguanylate cyclase (GGDEF)-like protein/PAS domain S-box-containing protein